MAEKAVPSGLAIFLWKLAKIYKKVTLMKFIVTISSLVTVTNHVLK